MKTNKNIMLWSVLFTAAFAISIYFFNPNGAEKLAFSLIGLSWLAYMVIMFLTIIALSNLPFVKLIMLGEDDEFNQTERKWSIILISAIVIASAIFISNVVPTLLIAAYSTSL